MIAGAPRRRLIAAAAFRITSAPMPAGSPILIAIVGVDFLLDAIAS